MSRYASLPERLVNAAMCCVVLKQPHARLQHASSTGAYLYITLCNAKALQGWLCLLKHALQSTQVRQSIGMRPCTTRRLWLGPWRSAAASS
jgi:hypothetical protein